MLTVARCVDIVRQALGKDLPQELSYLELIDDAGQWFTQSHQWSWLLRTGTVSTTANVSFVSLATLTGFRGLLGRPQYTHGWLEPAELSWIEDQRALTSSGVTGYPSFFAFHWTIDTAGALTPILELYQTPNATFTIRVPYRAGWQTPQSGSDQSRIAIPEDAEHVFRHIVRMVASAYVEFDTRIVAERYAEIKASDFWKDYRAIDSARQPNIGQMQGGAVLEHGVVTSAGWRNVVSQVSGP